MSSSASSSSPSHSARHFVLLNHTAFVIRCCIDAVKAWICANPCKGRRCAFKRSPYALPLGWRFLVATLKSTFCRICEPYCSLTATIADNGRVVELSPDRTHPAGGAPCHKGLGFLDVHNDPDRLDYPLKRQSAGRGAPAEFARTSWDEAIADIAGRLNAIRDQHGNNAIGLYMGNTFGIANGTAAAAMEMFRQTIGTSMLFGANTQDTVNKAAVALALYGSNEVVMIPDLDHTHYLLCIGSNPAVSRWNYVSVPNDGLEVLRAIRRRGGTVRFVNPRKIESSVEETGETLQIRPASDAYFLAAVLTEIERIGGIDHDLAARHGKNVEGVLDFARQFPAARVEGITGLSAQEICAVARGIVEAPSAAVYVATGANQSRQGMLCFWLAEMINFLTGNLGRKGGTFRTAEIVPGIAPAKARIPVPTSIGTFEIPDPIGYSLMPAATLPDFMENGDVRALIIGGGNPLLSVGGEERMREAMGNLDLLVSIDIFRGATGELADYILPTTDWLEHMDLNFTANGMQLRPYIRYTERMTAPRAERRNGWWTLARLSQEMGLPSGLDDNADAEDGHAMVDGLMSLRGITKDQLLAAPHHTIMLEQEPYDSVFKRCLVHPDGLIDCLPDEFVSSGLLERAEAIFNEMAAEPADVLKLISLRTRYMHNSWLVNAPRLRRGPNADNPLHMCEADAADRGIHDGDEVRISNTFGEITARVLIDDDLRKGVVAMTHGYGHRRSFGLTRAREKPGANCNALMPMGKDHVEPLSHMSWISGVPVYVTPVGPDDQDNRRFTV
ncbi:molybdopterin-containing oxidoreductase family protein [Sphingopyxis terrae]|uniref:molybdopterin-containing oxidoreductase family protein n=1 Tax=Sphingopyxis terrae TaxID=33052 RepID=UPI002A0DE50F|nr:molybdopterin-dependent oxidoreductase [Sphingopyxis terrae]MDX8356398.1 molybdopterin-dependent oxidoreductase [Sphingopyxis terrae]